MCAAIKTLRFRVVPLIVCILYALLLSSSGQVSATPVETKYPCAFIDTINVTGSYYTAYEQPITNVTQSNANAANYSTARSNSGNATAHRTYGNDVSSTSNASLDNNLNITAIPRELVAVYDFVIRNGVRVAAERHLRACVCKRKPCIRFCCSEGHFYSLTQSSCLPISTNVDGASDEDSADGKSNSTADSLLEDVTAEANAYALTGMDHREVAVRQANGSTRLVATAQHFNVHIEVPCERMRFIKKDNQLVHWTLYENGTIAHRNHLFTKHYCYTPLQLDNVTWEWQPLACEPEKFPFVLSTKEWTYAICLIIAVICMVIVLFVYLICTDLRNTFYGVALKAYSLCIIIGYSLMAHLTLTDPTDLSRIACTNMPCYVLLYIVLSFYILSFISFNFYMNFHGVILSRLMFWLIFFPIVLLAVGWSIFVAHDHYDGKPVLGGDTCWFDPRNWSIMIYFYAPIFVACVLCFFFYILTLIRISERRDFNIRKPNETLEENRFKSFWKFFMYTFTVWLACVCSFAVNYYRGGRSHINYAVCLFVALHGFGALYALIGKNQQVQNFLRRIDEDVNSTYSEEDDMTESAVPMSGF